jgi:filamentous hemagglutinin
MVINGKISNKYGNEKSIIKEGIGYTSDGQTAIAVDADGKVGIVQGFNDKTTGNAYIDVSLGVGNSGELLRVKYEEFSHQYIANEGVAKSAANTGLSFFNIATTLTGGQALGAASQAQGWIGSSLQNNWNTQYNTNTSAILNQNTSRANSIADEDKLYSVLVNNNKKIIKVIDDGNFNAYQVNPSIFKSGTQMTGLSSLQLDPIHYADIFIDPAEAEKMTEEQKEALDILFANKAVHDELLALDSFDKGSSVAFNVERLLLYGVLNQNSDRLINVANNGESDNTLLANMFPALYGALSFGAMVMPRNPMNAISNSFDIPLESREYIAPSAGELRKGSGEFDSIREKDGQIYKHNAVDILANEGDNVYAGADGTVIIKGQPYEINNGKLKTISIETNSISIIKTFYVQPANWIEVGTTVKQGDIIGTTQNLQTESPSRHNNGTSKPTPLHIHTEIIINGGRVDPAQHLNLK